MPLERTAVDDLGQGRRYRRLWLYRSNVFVDLCLAATRRLFDIVVAGFLSLLTLPIFLVATAFAAVKRRPVLSHTTYIGRSMRPISIARLRAFGPLGNIPRLWAVFRGDLSLVGPALMAFEASGALRPADLPRFQVKPGLASIFLIRNAANIAFEGQRHADAELIHTASLSKDLGILARSVPASLIGGHSPEITESLNILDVEVCNWTMDRAVQWIVDAARGSSTSRLAFVNPDCLNNAFENAAYKEILGRSEVVLPDGIGIHYACRILGAPLAANVNGTDLFPRLCDALGLTDRTVFFLGGRPGVTDDLCARIDERWPDVKIAGHHHGFFSHSSAEEEQIIEMVNSSGADILLVAFGAPHQEAWIDTNVERLGVAVAIGVGGLFDFYSGRIPRAPLWLRELGFEWAWRLFQEPGRMWRRYVIGNPLFLWRVWRWRRSNDITGSSSQGGDHVFN